MKILFTISLFLLQLFCISQNPINEYFKATGPANETFENYYPNGHIKITFTKKDGNLEGAITDYYKSGKIFHSGFFEHGHFHGSIVTYNEKGLVLCEEKFTHDTLLWSKEAEYHKNDSLKQLDYIIYDKDSLNLCPFKKYDLSMKYVLYDFDFMKLKSHGKSTHYHKNGKIKEDAPLVNNLYEGITKWYYEDGKIKCEGPYHLNFANGIFTYYSKTGKITKKETWVKGKKIKTEKIGSQ